MSPLTFNKPDENRPRASLTEFESKLTEEKSSMKISMDRIDLFEFNGEPQPFSIDKQELNALQKSIEQQGQLTPIIVRQVNDRYQILSGHKRFTACSNLGFTEIDAVVIEVDTDEQAFDIVCQANVQRKEPKPSELCRMYNTYLSMRNGDSEVTAESVCSFFNVSKKTMYRYANMSKLTDEICSLIDKKKISISAIEGLTHLSINQQNAISEYIIQNGSLSGSKLKKVIEYFSLNEFAISIESVLSEPEESESESGSSASDDEMASSGQSQTQVRNDLVCQIRNKYEDLSDYTDEEISEFVMMILEQFHNSNNN